MMTTRVRLAMRSEGLLHRGCRREEGFHIDDYFAAIYGPGFVPTINSLGYRALEFTANGGGRCRSLISSTILIRRHRVAERGECKPKV